MPDATPAFDWRQAIPPEYKDEKTLASYKDFGAFVKSAVEAQKLIGASIRLPSEKDPPEEATKKWQEIYTKLGRPETPEQYAASLPVIEGLQWDPAVETAFKQTAHQLGLTTPQLKGVLDFYGQTVVQQMEAGLKTLKESRAALEQEWGPRTDYNLQLAQKAMAHYGDADLAARLDQTGWGNDPALVKLFAKLGAELAEDGIINTDLAGQTSAVEEAKAKIAAIRSDRAHPYNSPAADAAAREAAIQEMDRLYAIAFGSV